ncbi:hypothetical protein CWI37_0480p0020 [Hamiltosporidium tvaerminnensis]|uniref:Uncharacterized protein n=1 Tax=Hamiltosporidium tvaerminnensis TaxID=1176355 RepID=A0A4Q9L4L3_9MICR|nr:hypothetical protein CWI37_0480p0020 [Hamiltosporidium tvaerminnensis]
MMGLNLFIFFVYIKSTFVDACFSIRNSVRKNTTSREPLRFGRSIAEENDEKVIQISSDNNFKNIYNQLSENENKFAGKRNHRIDK